MLPPEESDSTLEPTDHSATSAEDEDALHRSRQPSGETAHIGLPSEAVTFNIENVKGKNIQFGDRHIITYVTVDAIKIRNLIAHSPYKGLKPFEKDDTDRFFGRTAFVEKLFHELRSSNLLLLLGASGSGKSSVIRAGLMPRLAQESARFMALTLTPGQDPFEGLYTSLYPRFQEKAGLAREGKEDTLLEVVRSLKPTDEQWFLLIDQFEELFTTSAPERQKPFIAGMVRLNEVLAKEQNRSVQIIATMRSDFSHQLNEYPRLVNALKNQCLMLTAMQPDELRLAIEQPAAKHGVVFEKELMIGQFAAQPDATVEEGLVAQMMKDVQGQPGYLPLLQYTLDLLWETERQSGGLSDRTLNISTYQQLGGVRGALQKHVDEIYGKLTNAEQLAAQRIFLKLVEIGGDEASGTAWKAVRKRALRSDFADPTEQDVLARL
ncbi:MAG: hypothetical protein KME45_31000 [Stenomitos rutilans HA7619-LM2]|jgi:energy-coupling factor transporter ATP-binding protein EcfA2|nr:hypothetical protein [Stenomitos rutilans HA7619-LM2]